MSSTFHVYAGPCIPVKAHLDRGDIYEATDDAITVIHPEVGDIHYLILNQKYLDRPLTFDAFGEVSPQQCSDTEVEIAKFIEYVDDNHIGDALDNRFPHWQDSVIWAIVPWFY